MDELDLHLIERIEAKFAALREALARAEEERDRLRAERDQLRSELDELRRPVTGTGRSITVATSLDDDDWARVIDAG